MEITSMGAIQTTVTFIIGALIIDLYMDAFTN